MDFMVCKWRNIYRESENPVKANKAVKSFGGLSGDTFIQRVATLAAWLAKLEGQEYITDLPMCKRVAARLVLARLACWEHLDCVTE